jgi:hypothetical protein
MLPPEYVKRDFWQEVPRAPSGDEDIKTTYQAVGEALSHWEALETTFSSLFAVLVESRSRAASRAYGIIGGSRGRYDALNAAAPIFFGAGRSGEAELYAEFKLLMKALPHAYEVRNNIAHGLVVSYADYGSKWGGYYLASPVYNSRRTQTHLSVTELVFNPLARFYH